MFPRLIAIVDDTPDIVEMLHMLLEVAGYCTVSTLDSTTVPQFLAHHCPSS
jgi:CheY-like chemotaxis protein